MDTITVGLRIKKQTRDRLNKLGQIKDRSASSLMQTAVERYVESEEVLEMQLAEEDRRWEEYLMTGKSTPHSRVVALMDDLIAGKSVAWPV